VSVALPARLRGVSALVPAGSAVVADIGAGHGALSAALALRGCARVIATELGAGPLRELRGNLSAWRLGERVEVRCGPGLTPLAPGEVEVVVIAGVGANTMLNIAEEAPARGVRQLVLQCMQRDQLVAPWLADRGWRVIAVSTCTQRRREYTTRLVEVVA
jgi:tRNA (adenine22-N1)-methyltransferase